MSTSPPCLTIATTAEVSKTRTPQRACAHLGSQMGHNKDESLLRIRPLLYEDADAGGAAAGVVAAVCGGDGLWWRPSVVVRVVVVCAAVVVSVGERP